MGNGGQGMKLTAYPLSCQGEKITGTVILPPHTFTSCSGTTLPICSHGI
jgi:hypothetical protein